MVIIRQNCSPSTDNSSYSRSLRLQEKLALYQQEAADKQERFLRLRCSTTQELQDFVRWFESAKEVRLADLGDYICATNEINRRMSKRD